MITKLMLTALIGLSIPCQASSEAHGQWNHDVAHGYERYWTVNSQGSYFTIWCPINKNMRGALISINVMGNLPPPRSLVRIQLDRDLIKFTAGPDGYILNDCPACADKFTYFWHRLRSAGKLVVRFEDRRLAGFSLNGARDATPHPVCATQ
ncbi:hypothetical protein [Labrenzia sp. OB1]|uniref:hypothetical protein n=1 Tax=Labrenzia sp. OB1 TaxID=1561204 RepID=UPI0007B24BD5|nr:hypothetical protein [Labrenzia sp. OB1]KZM48615.1 hypothetical protein OA90_19630 [Labrenzia sp. OB1]